MIGKIIVKVCGITRQADAVVALEIGADYLGINCWDGSPRYVPANRRAALLREIPPGKRVAVTVNPTDAEASAFIAEGFDIIQVHFDPAKNECDPAGLSTCIGKAHLWLAPKLTDGAEWPKTLIPLAAGFIHDAHAPNSFGGTGKQADWARFQKLTQTYPDALWILAGGLGPTNVEAALKAQPKGLDLNSGVELAPGLKSAELLFEVKQALLKNDQS